MDQALMERLDILREAGEISGDIKDTVTAFAENFEKKYSLVMTEENASMLITHVAMALARIIRGEDIGEMDETALEEVSQSRIYNELPAFYQSMEAILHIKLPEAEKGFIALHACTLLMKLGK